MFSKQVIYIGHVQGVGFRYTVKRIASGYDVVGWVKNLANGHVEMQVKADDGEELQAFLDAIKDSALGGNIREVKMEDIAPTPGLRGFNIVH